MLCSNNTPIDMLGLYRSVVAHGGLGANEAYDAAGRYAGSINWVGFGRHTRLNAPGLLPDLMISFLQVPIIATVELLSSEIAACTAQAGDIFPAMHNYKRGHRATSIGTQLLSNYRKYLAGYEHAWAAVDLPANPLPPVRVFGSLCRSRTGRFSSKSSSIRLKVGRAAQQDIHHSQEV